MKKYFTINVLDGGNNAHVGTIVAENDAEFNRKLNEACTCHFDATVSIPTIEMENCLYKEGCETIAIGDDEQDTYNETILINQTWLF